MPCGGGGADDVERAVDVLRRDHRRLGVALAGGGPGAGGAQQRQQVGGDEAGGAGGDVVERDVVGQRERLGQGAEQAAALGPVRQRDGEPVLEQPGREQLAGEGLGAGRAADDGGAAALDRGPDQAEQRGQQRRPTSGGPSRGASASTSSSSTTPGAASRARSCCGGVVGCERGELGAPRAAQGDAEVGGDRLDQRRLARAGRAGDEHAHLRGAAEPGEQRRVGEAEVEPLAQPGRLVLQARQVAEPPDRRRCGSRSRRRS